ncbi:MAG: hypothetical protein ACYSVY_07340 [Planctomycetota bacterium]|jgi:hypothetical protein
MVAYRFVFVRILGATLALLTVASARVQALEYEDVLLPQWDPWGEKAVSAPFLMYDPDYNGGVYRMWYHAADDPYIPYSLDWIAHAHSTDAVNWTKTGPVECHDSEFPGGQFPGYYVTGTPVVVEEQNGSYKMYHLHYYPWEAHIYKMYSNDGGVCWSNDHLVVPTMYPERANPYVHSVLPVEGGYEMYYHATVWSEWRSAIFRAQSVDGENWTNHQEVLGPGEPWEHWVMHPDVVQTPEGSYVMYYSAGVATPYPIYPRLESIGVARSSDGINWTDRTRLFGVSDLGQQVITVSDPRYFVGLEGNEWLYFSYALDWDGDGDVDELRIARTPLADCNDNGIPDQCEMDCGSPDGPCDVPGCGQGQDCNSNGVPDDCEPDFDGDGLIDECDADMDDDGVPNEEDACDYTPLGANIVTDPQDPLYGTLRGDLDRDCDCDLADYAILELDLTGPNP